MGQKSSKKSRSSRQRIETSPQNETLNTNVVKARIEHAMQQDSDSNEDIDEIQTSILTDLPMDIILEIFSRLDVIDIISLQIIDKTWCEILRSQKLWRAKCRQYWPNYPLHAISDFFKFFLQRGGVYFIRSAEHLKKLATGEDFYNQLVLVEQYELPNGLVVMFQKSEKRFRRPSSKEFWSKTAIEFRHGCNLVLAPKFLEDEEYDYILLENSFTDDILGLFDRRNNPSLSVYSEKKIIKILLQVMNALKHLHQENIVVANWSDFSFVVDVFGDWFELKMDNYFPRYAVQPSTGLPNISFMAPETITSTTVIQSDMWTLGTLAYTFLTGVPPFYCSGGFREEYSAIFKGEFSWPKDAPITDLAKDFINHLILLGPLQRLTLKQAFEHPWITNPNPSEELLTKAESAYVRPLTSSKDPPDNPFEGFHYNPE